MSNHSPNTSGLIIPPPPVNPVLRALCGTLLKQKSGFLGGWNSRWFVIEEQTGSGPWNSGTARPQYALVYYVNQLAPIAKKEIHFSKIYSVTASPNPTETTTFHIKLGKGGKTRTYTLKAQNEADRHRWITILTDYINDQRTQEHENDETHVTIASVVRAVSPSYHRSPSSHRSNLSDSKRSSTHTSPIQRGSFYLPPAADQGQNQARYAINEEKEMEDPNVPSMHVVSTPIFSSRVFASTPSTTTCICTLSPATGMYTWEAKERDDDTTSAAIHKHDNKHKLSSAPTDPEFEAQHKIHH